MEAEARDRGICCYCYAMRKKWRGVEATEAATEDEAMVDVAPIFLILREFSAASSYRSPLALGKGSSC